MTKHHVAKFLKGLGQYRAPKDTTSLVIEETLKALDSPRSLAVYLLWKEGEHEQLLNLGFDPLHYNSAVDVRNAYNASKLLSKFKGLNLPFDRDEVALKKFDEFELLCRSTNVRFRNLEHDPLYKGPAVSLLHAMCRKIETILGDFTEEEFFSKPDWGPGASTLIKRRNASAVNKFQTEVGITRDLHAFVTTEVLWDKYPHWAVQLLDAGFPRYQVGNKVVTVDKDASTNRVIAIEPGINLWFQKSLGSMIRKRLLRCGVDLRYQSRNQQLAWKASKYGSLATVDMSSASDSIAYGLVRELLPPRWFEVMESCRSHFGVQNGQPRRWEKFSSMGNGFTFELESLIFYTAACCCNEYLGIDNFDTSVYGDDVILPVACFELFSELVTFLGFRINRKKSYFSSTFRESCGAHYSSGLDVKPYYLKDSIQSVPAIYRAANAIRRLARRHSYNACDARFKRAFELLVARTPSALRLRIPHTLGDGGFISNFDEATPVPARDNPFYGPWVEGWVVPNLVEVSQTYQTEENGYLLAVLWNGSRSGDLPADVRALPWISVPRWNQTMLEAIVSEASAVPALRRNSVPMPMALKLKLAMSIVPQWADLGPWL